jgi:hypothetical protein
MVFIGAALVIYDRTMLSKQTVFHAIKDSTYCMAIKRFLCGITSIVSTQAKLSYRIFLKLRLKHCLQLARGNIVMLGEGRNE